MEDRRKVEFKTKVKGRDNRGSEVRIVCSTTKRYRGSKSLRVPGVTKVEYSSLTWTASGSEYHLRGVHGRLISLQT